VCVDPDKVCIDREEPLGEQRAAGIEPVLIAGQLRTRQARFQQRLKQNLERVVVAKLGPVEEVIAAARPPSQPPDARS
jgi:hypothetical protein